jgi:hypothetical protein
MIVPSGTKRKMFAQSLLEDPAQEVTFQDGSQFSTEDEFSGYAQDEPSVEEQAGQAGQEEQTEQIDGASPDIVQYIFQKLESWGYPPRRLQQFEDDFLDEHIYSGGGKEVTIVLPDRYWGKKARLKDDDVNATVQEIQNQFGLLFVEAKRTNKQITLEFTSQGAGNSEDEEVEVETDILDEVYGTPKKGKGKKKAAASTSELIKESQKTFCDTFTTMNLKQGE